MPAKVISLAPYKDPDECIRYGGQEAFQQAIDKAQDFIDWRLSVMPSKEPKAELLYWVGKISEIKEHDTITALLVNAAVANFFKLPQPLLWEASLTPDKRAIV